MPADPPLPAGVVAVTARVTAADGDTLASNAVPLALVPMITSTRPAHRDSSPAGRRPSRSRCAPPVLAPQTVALVVGSQVVASCPRCGHQRAPHVPVVHLAGIHRWLICRAPAGGRAGQHPDSGRPDQLRPQPARGAVVTALADWESAQRRLSRRGPRVAPRPPADRADEPSLPGRRRLVGRIPGRAWKPAPPPALELLGDRLGTVALRAPDPAAVRSDGTRPGDGRPLRGCRWPAGDGTAHLRAGAQRPARAGLGRSVPAAAAAVLAAGRGASGRRPASGGQSHCGPMSGS